MSLRKLTIAESLGYELTILPTSLFDSEQYMRKCGKSELGKYLRENIVEADRVVQKI